MSTRTAGVRRYLLGMGVAASMCVVMVAGAAAETPRSRSDNADFRWSEVIARGKTLQIRGVNGSIHASAARGAEATIEAIKHAQHDDPDEVTIELARHEDGITVCAVYPNRPGKRPSRCTPHGEMNAHDNDTEVDFVVYVPAGVKFEAATVNGNVEALDLRGPVDASAVNGNIEVSTSQSAHAETVNGSVEVALGAIDELVEFSTVNGGIVLTLPAGIDADVSGTTMNGSIKSDFPIQVSGRRLHKRLEGKLGHGGPGIRLNSVNGSLELRRAD